MKNRYRVTFFHTTSPGKYERVGGKTEKYDPAIDSRWGAADAGAGASVASAARRRPSKRSLQALFVRPSVSTPMVARLTTVRKPVTSHGKYQRRRSIGGRYSGRSRSIRPPKASCSDCIRTAPWYGSGVRWLLCSGLVCRSVRAMADTRAPRVPYAFLVLRHLTLLQRLRAGQASMDLESHCVEGFAEPVAKPQSETWAKADVALIMLDTACKMFISGMHTLPILNLAAIAEETFGSILENQGRRDDRAISELARKVLPQAPGVSREELFDFIYRQKNAIKHYNRQGETHVVLDSRALFYTLSMALRNCRQAGFKLSPAMNKVVTFIRARFPPGEGAE
ncbi:putative phage-related protein, similar to zonula occudens toxin [Stenotrophomonas maltophilia K279a]|uniref:Phage-related protein, similar to zonula occudens toxin n=2 Tax=Lysobacteraceae TaxID=32033 RepID=B2FS66_STRMK|nr:putative phage-related protein, similar to zonula occudens toxin [Stenotrophomonas maltophilia K279a]